MMFHHFHSPGHAPAQGSISADQFADMIEWIGARRIVPARAFLERAAQGRGRRTDVCLTFDDNLRCQYDVALPVLQAYGLTAFWFIYTGPFDGQVDHLEIYRAFRTQCFDSVQAFYDAFEQLLDPQTTGRLSEFQPRNYLAEFPFYSHADRRFRYLRDELLGPGPYHQLMDRMLEAHGFDVAKCARSLWMSPAMIQELHEAGHVIGLHSHSHPTRLERLAVDQQAREYLTNFEHIHDLTGELPRAMSHPCNSYNDTTLKILSDLGIQVGFRANMSQPDLRGLEWPREDHANLLAKMRMAA